MPSFAITTPKYGVGEHVPKTLLSSAFISQESRNVRSLYGDYRAARGRLPALYDADEALIAAPKLIYDIIAVNAADKTITIDGSHATAINAAIEAGDPARINGSSGSNDGVYTFVSASDLAADTTPVLLVGDGQALTIGEDTVLATGESFEGRDVTHVVIAETPPEPLTNGHLFLGATPVLNYHLYIKEATGTEYLLLATAYHILLWNQSNRFLYTKFTCSTPRSVERWSITTHMDCVYATNNVDKVLKWNSTISVDNDFEALDGDSGVTIATGVYLTAAKCLYSKHGYLWLGGTTETGTSYPRRVRWSDTASDTFDVDGDGDAGVKDMDDECGFVTAFAGQGDYVIIATEKRMTRSWLTATDTPWYFATERVRAGCQAYDTLVNDREGRLYWLANDMTIRELEGGSPFTTPQAAQTIKSLNPEIISKAKAIYYESIDRLLFAVPTSESDHNDLVVEIDPYSQSVVYLDIPVAAFGTYTRQSIYTWDTLPYDTYDEWGAAWLVWDANANTVGFPLLLVADHDGYSYEFDQSDNDAEETLERKLVFETGLLEPQKHLGMFKRISQGIDLFFQRHASTNITVSVKTDGCRDWTVLGSSNLMGDGSETEQVAVHLDANLRAKHFTIRLAADGYFEFFGMYVDDFNLDGLR